MLTATRPQRQLPRRHPFAALAALIAVALLLAGCGLRFESGQLPQHREPDADEIARQQAVGDALVLAELARVASERLTVDPETELAGVGADVDRDELRNLLYAMGDANYEHLKLLGGTTTGYAGANGATDRPAPPLVAMDELDLQPLLAKSDSAAKAALTDLAATTAPLARLLASIAVSRATFAYDLADVTGLPRKTDPFAAVPTLPDLPTPTTAWTPLVATVDQCGYLLELLAARTEDTDDGGSADRVALRSAATNYRELAGTWAQALAIAGGDPDPRAVAYRAPLLRDVTHAEAVELLREAVGESFGTLAYQLGDLVAAIPPGERATAAVEMYRAVQAGRAWELPRAQLPGLREHAVSGQLAEISD